MSVLNFDIFSTLDAIPPEWTILGTSPPIRILSSVPESQRRMDCRQWTGAIDTISEDLVDILREEGLGALIPAPGRSFEAGPVALVVEPWYGARRRLSYLVLSTVVAEIWQAVLADGCRTYNFDILVGKGQGIKQGDHIGSIEILYLGRRPSAVARARLRRAAPLEIHR